MVSGWRMRAGMARQQPGRPQLVGIAKVLGFLTGQRYQPRLSLWRDVGLPASPWAVIEGRHHAEPHSPAQTALHGVMRHTDYGADRGRRWLRTIGQQNAGSFHAAGRLGA